MKTINYFQEFKLRFYFFLLCFFCNWGILYCYKEQVLFLLRNVPNSNEPSFLVTNLPEVFFVALKVTSFIGFLFSFPILLLQFWMYLQPALYNHEAKKVRKFLFFLSLLFFCSASLTIYFFLPLCWKFFSSFSLKEEIDGMNIHIDTRLDDYFLFLFDLFCLISFFCFFCFFFFQLLAKNSLFLIIKYRKFFHFLFFCFATLLTPPDIFSQLITGFFFSLLLEFFIIFFFIRDEYRKKANNGI